MDTAFVIPYRIRQVADKPGLVAIFGVSSQTIERNVLEPMREIYGKELVGTIKTGVGTAKCFGEEVYCIGCDKVNAVDRIRGLSLKYAYGDEIAGWNDEVFAMIGSRLDKDYSKFDGACNPEGPNHWFKKWLDKPKLDLYLQQYIIFDNPFLSKSFIDSLCHEYEGTVYYDRYILGKWALAEGLIYPMYQEAIQEPPQGLNVAVYEKLVLSIDYGTENAFAAILWGYYCGVWYGLKEYYYSGRTTGVPKTDEEYADDLTEFCQPVLDLYEERYKAQVAMDDPFAVRQKLLTIVDPSAASFITTLQKREGFKVKKAINDVADGIRDTAVAMKNGWIKISPNMKNWKDEAEGYVWDESHPEAGDDKPVKVKDHLCVTGDTLVDTIEGQVPIKDLVGQEGEVYCYDEESGEETTEHFSDVAMTAKEADIYELVLQDGTTIKATGDHPVLTQRGWVRVDALTSSDFIVKIGVDDVKRICVVCGKEFNANRYSTKKTCSEACRYKHRAQTRKERAGLQYAGQQGA